MLKIFSDRLKSARGEQSQSAAAAALGLSPMRLSNYESGKREPDLATLKRIVENYGVSADWLIGVTDNPSIDRGGVTNTATAKGAGAQAAAGGSIQSANEKLLRDIMRRIESLERRQNS